MATTLGFGFYAASFGNYNATYGSLGAVVVLLMWLYLSAHVLLGAEFNTELEHQAAHGTNTGPEKALGQREATMVDEVADDGPASGVGSDNAASQEPRAAKHDRNNVGQLIGVAAAPEA